MQKIVKHACEQPDGYVSKSDKNKGQVQDMDVIISSVLNMDFKQIGNKIPS